jgi:hypothetical protein
MNNTTTSPDIQYRALLQAVEELPTTNWLAKWLKDGESTDIAEMYRLFQQRVLGRAKHLFAELAATLPQDTPQAVQVTAESLHEYIANHGGYTIGTLRAALAAQPQAQPTVKEQLLALHDNAQPPQGWDTHDAAILAGPSFLTPEAIERISKPPAQSQACEPVACWIGDVARRHLATRGHATVYASPLSGGDNEKPVYYTHPPAPSPASAQSVAWMMDLAKEIRANAEDHPNDYISKFALLWADQLAARSVTSGGAAVRGEG